MRSLFAFWSGGAGASSVQAGFRSLFAFWAGGASGVAPTTTGGLRSLFAFWLGGAATVAAKSAPDREAYQLAWERLQERRRSRDDIRRDDQDLLEILSLYYGGCRP